MKRTYKSSGVKLYSKIIELLKTSGITQNDIAEELGISSTAMSLQLKSLSEGRGINTNTIFAIEKKTGMKIFNL